MNSASGKGIARNQSLPNLQAPFLVGRKKEQILLHEELAFTTGGKGRLVVLGGEAGIGKTSLVGEIIRQAETERCTILMGHCYDLAHTPPFGPWLDLFAAYQSAQGGPPAPAPFAAGRLGQVSDQEQLFWDVRSFLSRLAQTGPVLVVLEDLHWTDSASIQLIRNLAQHMRLWPMLLLLTYRVEEATENGYFIQHLPALLRESNGQIITLDRLDAVSLRSLVAGQFELSASDEDRLVSYLVQHSDGNPFHVIELLSALQETKKLHSSGDRWLLADIERIQIPPLHRQIVNARVTRLGASTRDDLGIAAVIGQSVPIALWSVVARKPEIELVAVIERATDANILESDHSGTQVRFVHALTRESLYESVVPPRRRNLHRQVADELLKRPDPDPDMVAFHLEAAGDANAWQWLTKAGNRAQNSYAWLTAVDRFQAALASPSIQYAPQKDRLQLIVRSAHLKRVSDPQGGLESMDQALALARENGDEILTASLLYTHGVTLCYLGMFREGYDSQRESVEVLESVSRKSNEFLLRDDAEEWLDILLPGSSRDFVDQHDLTLLRLRDSDLHHRRISMLWPGIAPSGYPEARKLAERYSLILDEVAEVRGPMCAVHGFSWFGNGIALASSGKGGDARNAFEKARNRFTQVNHHALTAFVYLNELQDVSLTYGAADPENRRSIAAEAENALKRAGGAFRLGFSPQIAWLGCHYLDGRWKEIREILDDTTDPGIVFLRREMNYVRSQLAKVENDADTCWSLVNEVLPEGANTQPGDCIHQEGLFFLRLAADLCLDSGDAPQARWWLNAHSQWLDWNGTVLGRAEGETIWSRLLMVEGATRSAISRARGALELAETDGLPIVQLRAHRTIGELSLSLDRFEDADNHLLSALQLAENCETPYEAALTLIGRSRLSEARGQPIDSIPFYDQANRIFEELGLASRQMLQNVDQQTEGLTPRELEVFGLLAQRYTNPEIADALFVSPRTVQTHVAHIFAKLGVKNRREAADAAIRLNLK